MELRPNSRVPDGLLAAMTLLSEKPHQGLPSWESALHQGINERNCTALLGLQFRCYESASDPVVAPNNVVKHYPLTTACSSTAGQVMGAVEGNFASFGNYSAGPFSVTFSPPAGMGVGSTIPISVGYFGFTQNMGVSVQSMSSQSMTFSTLPGGHLLYPASITFAASPAGPGSINFNINLAGNFNGATNAAKYYGGGALLENAQWNHFLGKVSSFCGGH